MIGIFYLYPQKIPVQDRELIMIDRCLLMRNQCEAFIAFTASIILGTTANASPTIP